MLDYYEMIAARAEKARKDRERRIRLKKRARNPDYEEANNSESQSTSVQATLPEPGKDNSSAAAKSGRSRPATAA